MNDGPIDGLLRHEATVRSEWVDYNGHLSEAYYVLVFGHATDGLLDHVGLDAAGRSATGTSIYTLEAHVRYLREVPERARLAVTTRVLGVDDKRLHVLHVMDRVDSDAPVRVATEELLCCNVEVAASRAAPFVPSVLAACRVLVDAQRRIPLEEPVGRSIRGLPH